MIGLAKPRSARSLTHPITVKGELFGWLDARLREVRGSDEVHIASLVASFNSMRRFSIESIDGGQIIEPCRLALLVAAVCRRIAPHWA